MIAVVAGGGLLAIATDDERWPFSPYAMYSWIRPASYTTNALVGVTAEGPQHEFPLFAEEYLHPFDAARLRDVLGHLMRRQRPAPALRQALRDCLRRYERRRRAGLHDGPALRGIRLYRLTWELVPGASNLERPEGKELIFEVARPSDRRA